MKIVVAVSGGVDSVVLLDTLARNPGSLNVEPSELVVAHFDHGMRQDSVADARFAQELAAKYGLPFETRREELGGASEELARDRRYGFLYEVAEKYEAKLATAHHLDDLVETVALNIQRGTRWRGLAGMSDSRIFRPLLKRTKSELESYAVGERLEWCEDETNKQDVYQRNRLRKKLAALPYAHKLRLYDLWQGQLEIRREVAREIEQGHFPISTRYFVTMMDQATACELVYEFILKEYGVSLLGPQLELLVHAIKVGRSHTKWQIGQGVEASLTKKDWRVQITER